MRTRFLLAAMVLAAALGSARAGETLELAGLTGTVPAEWKKEPPSNSMRLAQYRLPKAEGDKDDAELAFFAFPGGSGSLKDNLARQTAKFVEEGRTASDAKAKVGKFEATVQDVAGTFKKKKFPMATDFTPVENYRQLYVVFEGDKEQYYMTLIGPKATVEKHKKAFEAFLASFK